jgi:hypothetical protein
MTRIRPRSWSRSGWVLPSRTLARIAIAIGTLRGGEDAFDALRGASIDDMTAKFSELAGHPGQLREALRLPAPQTTHDLPADQRKALLKAAEIIAACWHGQWQRAAAGWLLLHELARRCATAQPSSRQPSSSNLRALVSSAKASLIGSAARCSW